MTQQVLFSNLKFGKSPLVCHVWNKDRTQIAVSTELGKVGVFKVEGSKTTLLHTLGEHTGKVTGIDWCPKTNQIATCSSDRNAFVWIYENNKWKPTLVLLRINRACTCIHWSPNGDKFAVGTGSRVIAVCYLDKANNFWVAKHIKKPIRSTITCLDWHPNNHLLIAGGTDFKVRVFSVFISDVEKKPDSGTSWGPLKPFGNMLAEYDTDGWVHSVAFDKSGDRAVAASHGSQLSFCSAATGRVATSWNKLPFSTVKWVGDNRVLAGGFDFTPELFEVKSDGNLQHAGSLDKLSSGNKAQVSAGAASARNFFTKVDQGGQAAGSTETLKSQHKNAIMHIDYMAGDKSNATKVSTCGLDGKVVVWDVKV